MVQKKTGDNNKRDKFIRKYTPSKHNPIRPIEYPEHTTTFLGDTAVTTNTLGEKNKGISGFFCYDADVR